MLLKFRGEEIPTRHREELLLDGVDAGIDGEVLEVHGVGRGRLGADAVEDGEVAIGGEGLKGEGSWDGDGEAEAFIIWRGERWERR